MLEKISFTVQGESEPAEFYVLEQTRIGGFSYILVTDEMEGDSQAWIMKDVSADGSSEAVFEFVEDEEELNAVGTVFARMLEDIDLV